MSASLAQLATLSGGTLVRVNETAAADLSIADVDLNAAETPAQGLFAALPGTRTHGAKYAEQSKAQAILTDPEGLDILNEMGDTRPVLVVDDIRAVLGEISADVHGHPAEKLTIVGVTGTSGKTTTTYMLEGSLLAAGVPTGIIGTTGTRINGEKVPSSLTTPEAPALQRLFHKMLSAGVTHVVMEVSSHALSLGRVGGITFDVTAFLNLSQDHLDFHNTLEEYFEAKATLFRSSLPLHAPQAVICLDDDWGVAMSQVAAEDDAVELSLVSTPHSVATTQADYDSRAGVHHWQATDVHVADNGLQEVTLTDNDGPEVHVDVPLPGAFNISNASVAWAVLAALGKDTDAARDGLAKVSVPGRMQRIDEGRDFLAVVDYAHKPAAVAEALATLRAQTNGKVIVVVGAGGDRDAAKRPIMGAEAVRGADVVIITDDNPRSEDPATIRAAVMEGARGALSEVSAQRGEEPVLEEIGDRAAAICRAVELASTGDSIIVAGKGHETGQDVGGVVTPFDDREQLREALKAKP